MAHIRPFQAVRPADGLADKIAALPYDVYSREEAAEKVKGDSYSFLRIDRPETQFPKEQDMYAPQVYEKANQMLQGMLKEGALVRDEKPCYYVYELTMDGRAQTGLVAVSAVDDYLTGVIEKHENTRKEKEADRIRHVDTCSAQTGPIFLAYRRAPAVQAILKKEKERPAQVDFVADDGVCHRVWTISNPAVIGTLTQAFADMPHTYIADGHHRAASAVRVAQMRRAAHPNYTGQEEFNYFLSVLFDADELKIMDYNRVIRDLNGNTPAQFLEKLAAVFTISENGTEAVHPAKKGEMSLFLDDIWYRLTVKEDHVQADPVEGLDVAYLQREVLAPVLGITDPATDNRIDFVGGIRGLGELKRRCHLDGRAAFAMYPTDIQELFAVADAGRLMPPKSTWFEPKLRSGLFIHTFER